MSIQAIRLEDTGSMQAAAPGRAYTALPLLRLLILAAMIGLALVMGGDALAADAEDVEANAAEWQGLDNCIMCTIFDNFYATINSLGRAIWDATYESVIGVIAVSLGLWFAIESAKLIATPVPPDPYEFWRKAFARAGWGIFAFSALEFGGYDFIGIDLMGSLIEASVSFGIVVLQSAMSTAELNGPGAGSAISLITSIDIAQPNAGSGALPGQAGFRQLILALNDQVGWAIAMGAAVIAESIRIIPPRLDLGTVMMGLLMIILWCVVYLMFPFKLLDALFKLAVVTCLLPIFLACWVFPSTRKYTEAGFTMTLNACLTCVMLCIIMGICTAMMASSLHEARQDAGVIDELMRYFGMGSPHLYAMLGISFLAILLIFKSDQYATHFAQVGGNMGSAGAVFNMGQSAAMGIGGHAVGKFLEHSYRSKGSGGSGAGGAGGAGAAGAAGQNAIAGGDTPRGAPQRFQSAGTTQNALSGGAGDGGGSGAGGKAGSPVRGDGNSIASARQQYIKDHQMKGPAAVALAVTNPMTFLGARAAQRSQLGSKFDRDVAPTLNGGGRDSGNQAGQTQKAGADMGHSGTARTQPQRQHEAGTDDRADKSAAYANIGGGDGGDRSSRPYTPSTPEEISAARSQYISDHQMKGAAAVALAVVNPLAFIGARAAQRHQLGQHFDKNIAPGLDGAASRDSGSVGDLNKDAPQHTGGFAFDSDRASDSRTLDMNRETTAPDGGGRSETAEKGDSEDSRRKRGQAEAEDDREEGGGDDPGLDDAPDSDAEFQSASETTARDEDRGANATPDASSMVKERPRTPRSGGSKYIKAKDGGKPKKD